MRYFFICSFTMISLLTLTSFYDLQFESIDGIVVRTSSFKGKKVVVAVASAEQKNAGLISYLDSIQKADDSVRVIVIPTSDFSGNVNVQALKDLKKGLVITVSKPMKVTKQNGAQQHALFSWLTKNTENSHFNVDVTGEGQLFVISAQGTLYSVLPKDTPQRIINRVINQSFTK